MSQAALLRRLQTMTGNQQAGESQRAPSTFGRLISPRDMVEAEQDRHRLHLASELLKIGAEVSNPEKFSEVADFALLAAAKIYPELPAENDPMPEPSREGAQSVLGRRE